MSVQFSLTRKVFSLHGRVHSVTRQLNPLSLRLPVTGGRGKVGAHEPKAQKRRGRGPQPCNTESAMTDYRKKKKLSIYYSKMTSLCTLVRTDDIAGESCGWLQICDFGLSKWHNYSRTKTHSASRRGTVTHIAPENCRDISAPRTLKFDVYSFAIMLWQLCTELVPFVEGRK